MNLTRVYTGVSRARFAAISDKVSTEAGLQITGDSGKVSHLGVTISWEYSESTLRVTLVHRDFFDPSAEMILKQLDTLVASTA